MDQLRRIEDAVLYEGYVLWPYRRTALKNAQRWTFGVVYPPSFAAASAEGYRSSVRARCLLEGQAGTEVEVTVRFLHLVHRQVERRRTSGLEPVDELVAAGRRYLTWSEATEREPPVVRAAVHDRQRVCRAFTFPGGEAIEDLSGAGGGGGGVQRRTWATLSGRVELSSEQLAADRHALTVSITNTSEEGAEPAADREAALPFALLSAHAVLHTRDGRFQSALAPPPGEGLPAAERRLDGLWPVLAGEPRDGRTLLAAPIILSDYPEVAPESPGDLFDLTEIDQLLIVSVLSMTPEEQDEARATDPRVAAILDRCQSLGGEQLLALRGAVRDLRTEPVQ